MSFIVFSMQLTNGQRSEDMLLSFPDSFWDMNGLLVPSLFAADVDDLFHVISALVLLKTFHRKPVL